MKKLHSIGFLLIIILVSYTAKAQHQVLAELTITPPSLQYARHDNLKDVLQKSLVYPVTSFNKKIQGTEIVRFSVTSDGEVEDIEIVKSLSHDIDNVVKRIIQRTSGKWEPGTIDGQKTTMVKELSLLFALYSYEDIQKTARSYVVKGNKLLFSENKPEKALSFYNKAYNLLPNNQQVLITKEFCLRKLGRIEEANDIREQREILAEQQWNATMSPDEEYITFIEPITILRASR